MLKGKSPVAFWDAIEKIYGEVPSTVKLVLQANEFNSFLALKGIRYDDKQEFFQSLEATMQEEGSAAAPKSEHQNSRKIKLKPGHRNYIMNLMLEIEKTEVNEFFEKAQLRTSDPLTTSAKIELAAQEKEIDQVAKEPEHGYSRDEEVLEHSEYLIEYLTDDTMDSSNATTFEHKAFYGTPTSQIRFKRNSESLSAKRRPDHMYNQEFLSQSMNPRRRRTGGVKTYPNTDEGTCERFKDLLHQSMQCILPREKLPVVEPVDIQVEKESARCWMVYCPICNSRIKLSVVIENGNRYVNYKRSNFERHLRFKHCKPDQETFADLVQESYDDEQKELYKEVIE